MRPDLLCLCKGTVPVVQALLYRSVDLDRLGLPRLSEILSRDNRAKGDRERAVPPANDHDDDRDRLATLVRYIRCRGVFTQDVQIYDALARLVALARPVEAYLNVALLPYQCHSISSVFDVSRLRRLAIIMYEACPISSWQILLERCSSSLEYLHLARMQDALNADTSLSGSSRTGWPKLQSLVISECHIVADGFLQTLVQFSPRLKSLELGGIYSQLPQALLEACGPSLETLDCSTAKINRTFDLRLLPDTLRSLQRTTILSTEELEFYPRSIRTIQLHHAEGQHVQHLSERLLDRSWLENLTSLRISSIMVASMQHYYDLEIICAEREIDLSTQKVVRLVIFP